MYYEAAAYDMSSNFNPMMMNTDAYNSAYMTNVPQVGFFNSDFQGLWLFFPLIEKKYPSPIT